MIKNIVLSGGGIKGIPILGSLKYLNETNRLNNIKQYAGSSIGAIIAALIIIGYEIEEIIQIILDFDLNKIIDLDINNIIINKSLLKGKYFKKKLFNVIDKKINPHITLLQLYKKTNINFFITVVCLNKINVEYINYENYPNLPLITALYMTSAIPLIFPNVHYNNNIYVDGGLIDNFPIHLFPQEETIGISTSLNELNPEKNILDYIYTILFINYFRKQIEINKKYKNIILLPSKNFDILGSNLTKNNIITMFHLGYTITKKFFISYSPDCEK